MSDEMESLMSRTPAQKQAKNCAEQARIVAPSRFVPYILHYRAAYTSVLRFYVACLDAGVTARNKMKKQHTRSGRDGTYRVVHRS